MTKNSPFELMVPKTGVITSNAWKLPANMNEADWVDAGKKLTKVDDAYNWWLGDWWAYGSANYGERKAVVESDEWSGPAFQTCVNVSNVSKTFETNRRRLVVPFVHHSELCNLPYDEQEQCLDWCEETHRQTGRVPTVRALRDKVRQIKAWLAQGWTQSQLERRTAVESGAAVVASKRKGTDGREIDAALIAWADQAGLVTPIDRTSDWGNPFEMGADGTRDEVCHNFEHHYLPHKPSLLKRLQSLRGRVLVCWCHPERCHGDHLAAQANGEAPC